jgi:large subunit ribosomal protein L18
MNRKLREKRKMAIRGKTIGTNEIPRLNVYRSNKHIYAALIDDKNNKTLLSVREKDVSLKDKLNKTDKAYLVGKKIGEAATKKGFKEVVFDRAGYLYHGRVKKLAEGARETGLKF